MGGGARRRADRFRKKTIGSVLYLNLAKSGLAEEPPKLRRSRQEVAVQGRGSAAMDGVYERTTARVRDPEPAARPEGGGKAACNGNLRNKMRIDIEAHHVIERPGFKGQCLRPGR